MACPMGLSFGNIWLSVARLPATSKTITLKLAAPTTNRKLKVTIIMVRIFFRVLFTANSLVAVEMERFFSKSCVRTKRCKQTVRCFCKDFGGLSVHPFGFYCGSKLKGSRVDRRQPFGSLLET
jgi:hypothetical protein